MNCDNEVKVMGWLDTSDLNLSLSLESCNDDIISLSCGDSCINININENFRTTCDTNDKLLQSLTSKVNAWIDQEQKSITLDMLLDKLAVISNDLGDDDNDDFRDDDMSYSDDNDDNNDNEMDTVPDSIDILILKRKLTEKLSASMTTSNDNDSNKILKSTQKVEHFSSDASSLALMNDFLYHYQNGRKEGIIVTAVDDDIFNWNVKFTRFNPDTQISLDLALLDEVCYSLLFLLSFFL